MALTHRLSAWLLLSLSVVFSEFGAAQPRMNDLKPETTVAEQSAGLPISQGSLIGINPLTGLPVKDDWILKRRPVMVKISNSLNVRPQSGLSFADLVFEYYIGEGINRFLGVFYAEDVDQVGPIRSGRLVDPQLVSMYQGILVYGSADPRVDKVITRELGERAISHLEIGCPVICGLDTHSNPGVFANTSEITRYAEKLGVERYEPEIPGGFFEPAPPSQGDYAMQIGVQYAKFNRGEWKYNADSMNYDRWTDDHGDASAMIPLLDRLTGQVVSFSNIALLFADYTEFNPTLHDIQIWENQDGQPAVFFRDGLSSQGYWRSPGHSQPLQFFNQQGLPYPLKPGRTWVIILSGNSTLQTPNPGQFEVQFKI